MDIFDFIEQARQAYSTDPQIFKIGILSCAIALFLLMLMTAIFISVCKRKLTTKCHGIKLSGGHGSLLVSTKAVEDFIKHALAIFEQVNIDKVFIEEKKSAYRISLKAKLESDANMVELKSQIESTVLNCVKERIGAENIDQVNIRIEGFSAKTNPNKHRKLAKEFYPEIAQKETQEA